MLLLYVTKIMTHDYKFHSLNFRHVVCSFVCVCFQWESRQSDVMLVVFYENMA